MIYIYGEHGSCSLQRSKQQKATRWGTSTGKSNQYTCSRKCLSELLNLTQGGELQLKFTIILYNFAFLTSLFNDTRWGTPTRCQYTIFICVLLVLSLTSFERLSKFGAIPFQEYVSEGITHPVFYGDLVYKLRRVKDETNFISSGSKILKRLRIVSMTQCSSRGL